MASRIRFNEAGDVFAAFPDLGRLSVPPAKPVEALAYARELMGMRPPSAAIAYLAHLLPRREAVWWGCQCVSAMLPEAAAEEGMKLATQWVREPDEPRRREALAFGQSADLQLATTWLARAAAHSGGSLLAPDQPPTSPAPDSCAQSLNAAVAIAATKMQPLMILPWFRACADAGVRFAAGEECKVIAPPVTRSSSPPAAPPAA